MVLCYRSVEQLTEKYQNQRKMLPRGHKKTHQVKTWARQELMRSSGPSFERYRTCMWWFLMQGCVTKLLELDFSRCVDAAEAQQGCLWVALAHVWKEVGRDETTSRLSWAADDYSTLRMRCTTRPMRHNWPIKKNIVRHGCFSFR